MFFLLQPLPSGSAAGATSHCSVCSVERQLSGDYCFCTVIDIFSKFSPVIDPRFSYRAEDVVMTLER
jgi:hypothetical protein